MVQSESLEELLSAITKGIASIDSFLVEVATDWNYNHPAMPPFDLADHRLNTEGRIDEWIPTITGSRLEKSGRNWQDYVTLRRRRNAWDQHDKDPCRTISLEELAEIGNLFGTGVAGVLFDLHALTQRRVPSKIVKFKYFPGFFVVTEQVRRPLLTPGGAR